MIAAENLSKTFQARGRVVHAVRDVSFSVAAGEAVGIVGESGCGKSTTARMLLRLEEPSRGRVVFEGEDVTSYRAGALRSFRSRAQLVFQNPFDALNPRFTIERTLREPLMNFGVPKREYRERIEEVLALVRLTPGSAWLGRRPHELSGGQLQRLVLARALIPRPKLIVADEPVSMLDVSARAGVLNLMREARDALGLAAIYISHDLALIRYVCTRTLVMYRGAIVEEGRTAEVIRDPLHPYTRALIAAVPAPRADQDRSALPIRGSLADSAVEGGCSFRDRCPLVFARCGVEAPVLRGVGSGRAVACHLVE